MHLGFRALVATLAIVVVAPAAAASALPSAAPSTAPAVMPSPTPSPAPTPTETPIPFRTVPPPSDVAICGKRCLPAGKPVATITRHGIRVEGWRTSTAVAPGTWAQVAIRVTNVGSQDAWQLDASCGASGTAIVADLTSVIPPGIPQTGNRAVLKRQLTRGSMDRWMSRFPSRAELWSSGTPWAECPGGLTVRRLAPGASRVEHFAWYAGERLGHHGEAWLPTYPGTYPFTVTWDLVARGPRPAVRYDEPPRTRTVRLSIPLRVTGAGPSGLSLPELVDRALADPVWRAWVDEDRTRSSWGYRDATLWAGPAYPPEIVMLGDLARFGRPYGVLAIELDRALTAGQPAQRAQIALDPLTGAVLERFMPTGWSPARTPPGAAPSAAGSPPPPPSPAP